MFCPHCGKEIAEILAFCQNCGARVDVPPDFSTAEGERVVTPWENRENLGTLGGLVKTFRDVLLTPSAFFKKMPVTGGLSGPLLFALIVGMAGLMFLYFWDILFRDSLTSIMTQEMRAAGGHSLFESLGPTPAAFLMPFLLIFWLFIVSGMLHLFLLLVRGAKAGYEATFRVVSYSVPPFLLMVIPFCGMPIASLWVLALIVIGLRDAHETTAGKATVAVFFPFLLCCGISILSALLFMGAIAASFGAMMHLYQ